MFSSHATHSAPATIEALRIFSFDYDERDTNPDKGVLSRTPLQKERYLIVAAAASMALDLLSSPAGYEALEECAKKTLEGTAANLRVGRLVKQYKEYTKEFFKCIRMNFPIVVVRKLGAMNARTTKHEWYTPETKRYVSIYAGVIEINELLLRRAFFARDAFLKASDELLGHHNPSRVSQLVEIRDMARDSLLSLILRLGITLAHEICHIQTSFLLHLATAQTPPEAGYGSNYVTATRGEAGRFWEFNTFGGYIDMQGEHNSDYGVIVAVRHSNERVVWRILPQAAWSLVQDRDFSCLPLVHKRNRTFNKNHIFQITGRNFESQVDIFKGKRRIGPDGAIIHPFRIQDHKRLWMTRSPGNAKAYLIKGPHIRHWLFNEPNNPNKEFEGAQSRTVLTVAN